MLKLDPENATAHANLREIYALLGEDEKAAAQQRLHLVYKEDDNAPQVRTLARAKYPAANRAAEALRWWKLR